MQKFFMSCTLVLCSCLAFSQGTGLFLAGTAGETFKAGGYQLSYSIGEPVILPSPSPTFTANPYPVIVTIGFQQPHVATTGGLLSTNNWVSAYPNPTTGHVRLDIHGDNFQANYVRIYNAAGQVIVVKPFVLLNGSIDLDLYNLPAGSYNIAVTDANVGNTINTTIIKLNK